METNEYYNPVSLYINSVFPRQLPNGRDMVLDMMKKWKKESIQSIEELRIFGFHIPYITAFDFACMENIKMIAIEQCNLQFFSGKLISG
jgi:hypothetical protein